MQRHCWRALTRQRSGLQKQISSKAKGEILFCSSKAIGIWQLLNLMTHQHQWKLLPSLSPGRKIACCSRKGNVLKFSAVKLKYYLEQEATLPSAAAVCYLTPTADGDICRTAPSWPLIPSEDPRAPGVILLQGLVLRGSWAFSSFGSIPVALQMAQVCECDRRQQEHGPLHVEFFRSACHRKY